MTRRPPLLVKVLNAALGLELADFAEARAFLLSDEGSEMVDDWLASQPDDTDDDAPGRPASNHVHLRPTPIPIPETP